MEYYSFELESNQVIMKFLDIYIEHPGRGAGKLVVDGLFHGFNCDIQFSPTEIAEMSLSDESLSMHGWEWSLILKVADEKDFYHLTFEYDSKEDPIGSEQEQAQFRISNQKISLDAYKDFKETLGYFTDWLKAID